MPLPKNVNVLLLSATQKKTALRAQHKRNEAFCEFLLLWILHRETKGVNVLQMSCIKAQKTFGITGISRKGKKRTFLQKRKESGCDNWFPLFSLSLWSKSADDSELIPKMRWVFERKKSLTKMLEKDLVWSSAKKILPLSKEERITCSSVPRIL